MGIYVDAVGADVGVVEMAARHAARVGDVQLGARVAARAEAAQPAPADHLTVAETVRILPLRLVESAPEGAAVLGAHGGDVGDRYQSRHCSDVGGEQLFIIRDRHEQLSRVELGRACVDSYGGRSRQCICDVKPNDYTYWAKKKVHYARLSACS